MCSFTSENNADLKNRVNANHPHLASDEYIRHHSISAPDSSPCSPVCPSNPLMQPNPLPAEQTDMVRALVSLQQTINMQFSEIQALRADVQNLAYNNILMRTLLNKLEEKHDKLSQQGKSSLSPPPPEPSLVTPLVQTHDQPSYPTPHPSPPGPPSIQCSFPSHPAVQPPSSSKIFLVVTNLKT